MRWPWTRTQTRASYARTTGDLLVNDPDGFPSESPPVWWYGLDSGAGAYPVGPHGPFGQGQAEAVPAVLRATALIVDPIAQSPLKVQELGFGGKPLGTPRWLTDPMLLRDDGRFGTQLYPASLRLPRSLFWGDLIRSSLWWGVGGFICQSDETGQPLAGTMRLVNPRLLSTTRAGDGSLRWSLGTDSETVVFDRDGFVQLGSSRFRLVTLRNPHSPVDPEGHSMGVFEQSPSAFRLSEQVDAYTSGQFRSGVPNGYLKVDTPGLTQDQASELKARWMAAHGNGRRSIAVLNATTQFVPINLTPVDAALDQVKRLNVADVAFAFSIDPNMLGAGLQNSASYSNVRDYFRQHAQLGIGLWVAAFQDVLSALLPGTQGVKVDFDAFTRAEPRERYEAYQVALTAGVLTVDEVRALEGLPELPAPAAAPVPVDDAATVVEPASIDEARARRPAWLH
jgi:Phage portal protein